MKRFGTYLLWVATCELAGLLGGIVTAPAAATWFPTLAKPSWTPPGWMFGPIWTVLYALMGIAAARIWIHHRGTKSGRLSLVLFGLQLALNCTWSSLFFVARVPGFAFAEIILLWITILALVLWWWWLDRKASLLLLPYLAWVAFAGALNAVIWNLNP